MLTKLKAILLATCAFSGVALADRGPEFQRRNNPPAAADQSLAASEGKGGMHPVDAIPFALDSAALDSVDLLQVTAAARWMKSHPRFHIVLEGYADASGNDTHNLDLASRRALAVREELVRLGVAPDRVTIAVYGESKLRSKNPAAQANRVVVMYATRTPAVASR